MRACRACRRGRAGWGGRGERGGQGGRDVAEGWDGDDDGVGRGSARLARRLGLGSFVPDRGPGVLSCRARGFAERGGMGVGGDGETVVRL